MADAIITPSSARNGWLGPAAFFKAYKAIGDKFPDFFIAKQTAASNRQRAVLWDYSKIVNGGKHLPTFTQEIGDCVSMGAANAINYLACVEIAKLRQKEKFHSAYQPYIYGISRVQIGKGQVGRQDGSLGIWAAQGVKKYGVLRADEKGVPPYSGAVAKAWGQSGPPTKFITLGKQHLIRSVAQVRTYEQIRDALFNYYPVTVASNRGFVMKPTVSGGKSWGVPRGEWGHQMCFIGVDDDPRRPGCYVMNSWGAAAHGKPADDAPPGGFWVDAEVVTEMAAVGDSWAYSQFDGYPEQDRLDFLLISD